MPKRQGNRPDRRVAPADSISRKEIDRVVARARYTGSALHKLHPGDYGFVPSQNPRPSKSPCDELRPILREEATQLFRRGMEFGMMSRIDEAELPKYVWAVDSNSEVYEAKIGSQDEYHGYRLGEDEREMRRYILDEWKQRCPKS